MTGPPHVTRLGCRPRPWLLISVIAIALLPRPGLAQISIGSGVRINPPTGSMKDLRDQDVIKQRFDFSCGAAALATILRFGFGEDVTEAAILASLFDLPSEAEKDERRRKGFSLLDLQRVAEGRGYNAQGFRLAPDQLSLLGGPVIVFIEPRGYKHFAVLRGARGDRVYIADPSRGQVRLQTSRFLDSWVQPDGKGIIFVVEPRSGTAVRPTLGLDRPRRLLPEVMTVRELIAVGNRLTR
jgi:predicted double-glycine peptidase